MASFMTMREIDGDEDRPMDNDSEIDPRRWQPPKIDPRRRCPKCKSPAVLALAAIWVPAGTDPAEMSAKDWAELQDDAELSVSRECNDCGHGWRDE
jgi:DNA-directed RNA polymerase subunit M/transcription elongation factor TFIIS